MISSQEYRFSCCDGSEAGCQFVKDVLDDYEKREFIYPEGL